MRLGFVGMLSGNPREHRSETFDSIRKMGVSGVGFHLTGELLDLLTATDVRACRERFLDSSLDLPQMAITYSDCLFDPLTEARAAATRKILHGARIASELCALTYLIRPGSLNPAGSWTPHPENHTPDALNRLIATLRDIADGLKTMGVTCVLETHVISILRSPEVSRTVIDQVDSPLLKLVADPVNHFESLHQAYESIHRLNHIFDLVGADSPVLHIKDIKPANGLVVHLDEAPPGEGVLDLETVLRRFHGQHPNGYGLVEHLPDEKIPAALEVVRKTAGAADVPII